MDSLENRLIPLIAERFIHEEKYRQGHIRIINALDGTKILGVHIPLIKKLSKEIVKEGSAVNYIEILQNNCNICYEEKLVWGQLLNLMKLSLTERFYYISLFVPKIANWAECDTFCCNAVWAKKLKDCEKQQLWEFLSKYWSSKREFEVRYAVIMSMVCFLDDVWIKKVFKKINSLKFSIIKSDYPKEKILGTSPYYVRMGVAWLLATSLYKNENATRDFVKNSTLPDDVIKLYVRKARESFRTKTIKSL